MGDRAESVSAKGSRNSTSRGRPPRPGRRSDQRSSTRPCPPVEKAGQDPIDLKLLESQLLKSNDSVDDSRVSSLQGEMLKTGLRAGKVPGSEKAGAASGEPVGRKGGILRVPAAVISRDVSSPSAVSLHRTPRPGVDIPRSRGTSTLSDPSAMLAIPVLSEYERVIQRLRQTEIKVKSALQRLERCPDHMQKLLVDMLTGKPELSYDLNILQELCLRVLDIDADASINDGIVQLLCASITQYCSSIMHLLDEHHRGHFPDGIELEKVFF